MSQNHWKSVVSVSLLSCLAATANVHACRFNSMYDVINKLIRYSFEEKETTATKKQTNKMFVGIHPDKCHYAAE